jgi:hypothetical protein
MEMAMESMEMAPEAIPRPGRVPEQRLLSLEIGLQWRRRCGTFHGWMPISLGFSRRRLYIGGGVIRLKRIYNFWCSMIVYTPFALCFVYTSWRFYAFSGTNLLTRCHSASFCFLLFLCFRKVTQEIFSKLDETKAEVPNYLTRRQSPKESRRRTKGQPHLVVARPRRC